ncbi:MAG TPA: adenylate/guanylate cyclase domain-containing protein [Burkholderiales bacterium]|nr:adenylate/guanylate cyclase domain-containing protein [Burkholderiales bacterium]
MKAIGFSFRGYLLCVLSWICADSLFVSIRFVGLSTVPAFATLDYDSFDHGVLFTRSIVIGFMIGTLFYAVNRAVDMPAIRRRPYGVLIAIQALFSLACVIVLLIVLRANEIMASGKTLSVAEFESRLLTVNFVVILVYYAVVSFTFSFIAQIDRKFGPGILRKLVTGAFYHPREIELIFMFLDLKDSTTHAERLGHLKFANLIQDCFLDLSVVGKFGAQVYQHVGDEAVLFWEVADGVEKANCLQAYFAFNRQLQKRKEHYQGRYGLIPQFKAGVNVGLATALEVGEIKREIQYLGDVVNTTARIQAQCNAYQETLLISETLRDRLQSVPDHLDIDAIGMTELRGRAESVKLYRVRERPATDPSR